LINAAPPDFVPANPKRTDLLSRVARSRNNPLPRNVSSPINGQETHRMDTVFKRLSRQPRTGEVHIEATDARQGRWGRHALWILVCSTVLAIVALLGSWMYRAGDLAAADATKPPATVESRAVGAPGG
jgi:hypothetical protein